MEAVRRAVQLSQESVRAAATHSGVSPTTTSQVERRNRTIKDATVKRDAYDGHEQLRARLHLVVDADNDARRSRACRALRPASSS